VQSYGCFALLDTGYIRILKLISVKQKHLVRLGLVLEESEGFAPWSLAQQYTQIYGLGKIESGTKISMKGRKRST